MSLNILGCCWCEWCETTCLFGLFSVDGRKLVEGKVVNCDDAGVDIDGDVAYPQEISSWLLDGSQPFHNKHLNFRGLLLN